MRKATLIVVALGVIAAGGVATWLLRQREQPAQTPEPSAAAAPNEAARGAVTGAQGGAPTQAAPAAAPQSVPGTYPREVSPETAALIDQLERPGFTDIQAALVQKGPAIVPELLAALRSIVAQQNAQPPLSEAAVTGLEMRKLQLYAVLSQLATRDAAPVLIDVALRSRPNSYAFGKASDALDAIGATAEADAFAIDLAGRPDASKSMVVTALDRFLYRPAPAAVQALAERWLDASADYRLRNPALRVIAMSGQQARAQAAFQAMLADPRTVDYTALSSIAEMVPPDRFARLIQGASVEEPFRDEVMKHNRYAWADAAEKTRTARSMLGRGSEPEAQAIALKHLLETGQSDLLPQLGVAAVVPGREGEPGALYVRPDYKVLIARLGFRLSSGGDHVLIERAGPSKQ